MKGNVSSVAALSILSWCLSGCWSGVQGDLSESINRIYIEKHRHVMQVFHDGRLLKEYSVVIGKSPIGHKQKEGDGKTPEGNYVIALKSGKNRYYKSLLISYPNEQDKEHAKKRGDRPGGEICIHGLGVGREARILKRKHKMEKGSLGCIVVTNQEITEIYNNTQVGTKVEIVP